MDSEFQARHIALETLRQRCEYLQRRLGTVEEENYKLKVQRNTESSTNATDVINEKILFLDKQNSQLSHQIQMITAENQTLWSQLSKLMSGNETLGQKLSAPLVSSSKLNQSQSVHQNPSSYLTCDYNKESLEEISLKLINGILMGKNELEDQYSQMIDLQKENECVEVKNFSFSSSKIDNKCVVHNVGVYVQKLKDFKQLLHQQKGDLSDAITNLKNYQKKSTNNQTNTFHCDNVNIRNTINSGIDTSETVHSRRNMNGEVKTSDKICPMCGEAFVGNYTNFIQHVSDHFEEETDEFVDASTTFEVIP